MAQTTILAAGQTPATSTNIVLATGVNATVGIFTDMANGDFPTKSPHWLQVATPGADRKLTDLATNPPQLISGPGTFRVVRPDMTSFNVNTGVYLES